MNGISVSIKEVSKKYPIYDKPIDRLKESFSRKILRKDWRNHREFWALKDISFDVLEGSTVGIIGQNGSGKSTLLQIVAGIMKPTTGEVKINGRVSALLELGAGFNPEFTGRENVFMNGAILGIDENRMKEKFDDIERFAEIGDFIDRPVKTYSSGMFVRLAFAVAINVDPDILIVDEVLAVGDVYFQHRCMNKINSFREQGKTILFVSHDPNAVRTICNNVILIDKGQIVEIGPPDKTVAKYLALLSMKGDGTYFTTQSEEHKEPEKKDFHQKVIDFEHNIPNIDYRYGNKKAEICGISVYDEKGNRIDSIEHGKTIIIRISAFINTDIENPNIGFMLRNKNGLDITGTNTQMEGHFLPAAKKGQVYSVDFRVKLPYLHPDNYSISPAIADGNLHEYEICDWIENAYALQIIQSCPTMYGVVKFPINIEANILNESLV